LISRNVYNKNNMIRLSRDSLLVLAIYVLHTPHVLFTNNVEKKLNERKTELLYSSARSIRGEVFSVIRIATVYTCVVIYDKYVRPAYGNIYFLL